MLVPLGHSLNKKYRFKRACAHVGGSGGSRTPGVLFPPMVSIVPVPEQFGDCLVLCHVLHLAYETGGVNDTFPDFHGRAVFRSPGCLERRELRHILLISGSFVTWDVTTLQTSMLLQGKLKSNIDRTMRRALETVMG